MKTKQNIKAIILGLVIAVGAGYVSAWTGPSLPPTGGNVPAPINVGGRDGADSSKWYTQTKTGILNLAHLITSDLTVTTGTPVAGQVLMASSSAGDVKWGNAAGGSGLNAKSWVNTVALAAGQKYTISHGFTNGTSTFYRASIVKVSNITSSSPDSYAIGDEVGIESFSQWPNSYNRPFTIYTNANSITVYTDANMQIVEQRGDGSETFSGSSINTADMQNWRLKITAIGK